MGLRVVNLLCLYYIIIDLPDEFTNAQLHTDFRDYFDKKVTRAIDYMR